MKETKNPVCPKCEQSDQVEKVSTIYLEGIAAGRRSQKEAGEQRLEALSKSEIVALRRQMPPPSLGKREVTRMIHPDLVIVAFTGILPVFLVGIARSQPDLLLPALLVMVVFYAFYFWRRRALIARFERQKQAQQDEKRRIERAIGRWMRTYYCARDAVVFEAGLPGWAPVEQMDELLMGRLDHQESPIAR